MKTIKVSVICLALLLLLVNLAAAQQCWSCSHEVKLGWRYCPSCGKKVTGFRPKEKDDYLIGISGPTEKVYQDVQSFEGIQTDRVGIHAARNETEAFQVVIYALSRAVDLDLDSGFQATDLRAAKGKAAIKSSAITALPIGYIPTKSPYYGEDHRGPQPDPLALARAGSERTLRVPKGEVRPIWISVCVPRDCDAGPYTATLTIKPRDLPAQKIRLDLTVWDFTIPDEHHLPFTFDSIGLAYGYPRRPHEPDWKWRKRLDNVRRELFTDMLENRITPIRSVGEPDFIGMGRKEPGFNYRAFDRRYELYVEEMGQPVFAVGPEWPGWGTPKYGRWQAGKWIGFRGPKQLTSTYRAIGKHLSDRGWHEGAFSYIIDETGGKRTKEITRLVHKGDPLMKNLCTIMVQEGYPDIDIWCPRMYEFDRKRLKLARKLQAKGKEIWTYTSSPSPPFPALVMDWDLINCRILPWMCWKLNLDGYLNWCVDWWQGDVWKNPNNFAGQNGNGFIYYPAEKKPIPSLRVKAIRDGLEDYEYLWLLRERLKEMVQSNRGGRYDEAIDRAKKALSINPDIVKYFDDFTHEPALIYAKREEVGSVLSDISKTLKKGE